MRDATMSKSIACMNVKFSPNLGDGLLSECLETGLIEAGAAAETTSIDLAGRTGYSQFMPGRGTAMKILEALPDGVRHLAVRAPLALQARRKWAPHYMAHLSEANAVVIGGGNLLSDHDLNFPTKLALSLQAAERCDVPVCFYACGMGQAWSKEGDRRVRKALELCQPKAVFLRDQMSKERWDERFGDVSGQMAEVVRDPGLLARDTYGGAEKNSGEAPLIGLGIMSHVAVRYHADARQTETELLRWYADLARSLVKKGARVRAFTNGASEDVETLDLLKDDLLALGEAAEIATPKTPHDLSDTVAGLDGLVAYRMHALIAAYSHRVPAVALRWDDKVDAFLGSVARLDWLHDPADVPPHDAADLALKAAEFGIDGAQHKMVIKEARQDVARLYAVFKP